MVVRASSTEELTAILGAPLLVDESSTGFSSAAIGGSSVIACEVASFKRIPVATTKSAESATESATELVAAIKALSWGN